jgi:hypothetical protein
MTDRIERTREDQEIIMNLARHRADEIRCAMLADGCDPADHLDEVISVGIRLSMDYVHQNPHVPPKPHAPNPNSPWAKSSA